MPKINSFSKIRFFWHFIWIFLILNHSLWANGTDTAQKPQALTFTTQVATQIAQKTHSNLIDSNKLESSLSANAMDTTQPADTNIWVMYTINPFLELITWPLEKAVFPISNLMLIPIKKPIQYIMKNSVIDSLVSFISIDEKKNIMLYPVATLRLGSGSTFGITYRHQKFLGFSKSNFVTQYVLNTEGDQKVRSRFTYKNLLDSDFSLKLTYFQNWSKAVGIVQPVSGIKSFYSDSSWGTSFELQYPIFKNSSIQGVFQQRIADLGSPNGGYQKIVCEDGYLFNDKDCQRARGIGTPLLELYTGGSYSYNSLDNDNIPQTGLKFSLAGGYHFVEDNHDFVDWGLKATRYFYFGNERYEMTEAEVKELGPLNYDKVKKYFSDKDLPRKLLKRKVVVTQIRLGETYELPGNSAPIYSLKSIGNTTPLRGVSGSPYRNWAMTAASLEYRFPLMPMVEGTLFNEYGYVNERFYQFDWDLLKNSWGFGIRVARKDIFLFRAQFGFEGLSYPLLNLTVDQAF